MRPVRHVLLRALLALLAFIATAAPAAAAVGEGVLASRAGRSPVVVHVEDARRAQCPYVHADDCVLCAALAFHALPPGRPEPVDPLVDSVRVVPAHLAVWLASRAFEARYARGPPTD